MGLPFSFLSTNPLPPPLFRKWGFYNLKIKKRIQAKTKTKTRGRGGSRVMKKEQQSFMKISGSKNLHTKTKKGHNVE